MKTLIGEWKICDAGVNFQTDWKSNYKLGFDCDYYPLRTDAKQNYKPVSGKNKNALMPIVTWEHLKNYQKLLMAPPARNMQWKLY